MVFSNIRMTGAWAFRSTPFISFSIFFAVAWRHHLNFSIRKICNIHKWINGVLLKKFRMKSPHLRIILKPYVTILPKINIWNPRLQSSKRVILSHVRIMANYHNTTNVSNHKNSSRACGNETTTWQKVFVQSAITVEIFKSTGEEK